MDLSPWQRAPCPPLAQIQALPHGLRLAQSCLQPMKRLLQKLTADAEGAKPAAGEFRLLLVEVVSWAGGCSPALK